MATVIKNGQSVTLSTTEVAYEISGDHTGTDTQLFLELESGTCSSTIAGISAAPILDATYTSRSTAGDKWILTIDPGRSTLRMKCASSGVVRVNW